MGLNKTTSSSLIKKVMPFVKEQAKEAAVEVKEVKGVKGVYNKEAKIEPGKLIPNFYVSKGRRNLYDIKQKIELIEDPEIKKILSEKINSRWLGAPELVEDAADAVNIMSGKYVNVKNDPRDFYKWLKERKNYFADIIDGEIKNKQNYGNKYTSYYNDRKVSYKEYVELFEHFKSRNIPETFAEDIRLEAFRAFINKYSESQPELVKSIYLNSYLPTVPKQMRNTYKQIHKDYGTMVISSNKNLTGKDADFILEELRLWKEAGKDKAKLPEYINVDYASPLLYKECAGGIAHRDKYIIIKDLLNNSVENSGSLLRHEMNHINDAKYEYLTTKTCSRIIINPFAWKIKKLLNLNGLMWRKELKKAGIGDKDHRKYAMKNRKELKSVSVESDIDKLSNKFKKILINLGLQDWVLNLPQNKVLKDARRKILIDNILKNEGINQ